MRILIVDDHELVRRGIRSLLSAEPAFTVCGEAVDGKDAVEKAAALRPDLVVMDISMPNMNGLEATREIKRLIPQTEVVIMSQHETSEMFRQAVNAGASAYVSKSSISTDLMEAIAKAGRHEACSDPFERARANHALDAQEILQRSAAFEKALRESEERFRSAMNSMAEGLYTIDTEGRLTYINPSAEAMFGWKSSELLGKKMHDVIHYKHPDGSPFPITECPGLQIGQSGIEVREREDFFIRKDGSFFPVVCSGSPLKINGAVLGVVVCFRDDSGHREAKEALKREVAAMNILQQVSTRLVEKMELAELVEMSLDAAIALTGAQRGNIQLFDAATRSLRIAAQRGFEAPFLDFFTNVGDESSSSCAAALQRGERIAVEDVLTSEIFAGTAAQQVLQDANVRAVQSTPLFAHSGRVVGIVSTHFEAPHRLSQTEGHALDVLARQTADFIERCEAEEELRRTAAHLQLVTDTMAVATTRCSRDLRYLYVNRRCAELLGKPAEEIIGRPIVEILGKEAFEKLLPYFETVLRGEPVSYEEQVFYQSAGPRWISAAYVPTFDSAGTADGWVASIVDITERKREERTPGLLASIVDSSDDAIISKSLEGIITSWNKGAERLFGYPADEAIGRHITLIVPASRRDEESAILERLRRGERVDHFETVRVRKDGATLNVSLTISPVKNAAGRVIGASKVARDITERSQIERVLAERAMLLELSNDAILVRDAADRITYWNTSAAELYGYSREEALGRVSHELLRTEFPEPLERIDEHLHRDSRWTGELTHRRKDGSQILVVSRWALDRDSSGNRNRVLETNNDITRQKQNEEALRESENRLRALTDTLETQVRIRTEQLEQRNREVLKQSEQLGKLSGHLMRIQDEERRHIARELHDSAGQTLTVLSMNLAAIVQRSLNISPELAKVAEEGQELVRELSKEIRTTSYLLHPPLLDESGLHVALGWYIQGLKERSSFDITLSIPEDFGRLPREMELMMFRLVQECLTNVHRHSGSSKAAIRIASEAGGVSLEVQDEGKGIPPETLSEIQSQGARGRNKRNARAHPSVSRPYDYRFKRLRDQNFIFPPFKNCCLRWLPQANSRIISRCARLAKRVCSRLIMVRIGREFSCTKSRFETLSRSYCPKIRRELVCGVKSRSRICSSPGGMRPTVNSALPVQALPYVNVKVNSGENIISGIPIRGTTLRKQVIGPIRK